MTSICKNIPATTWEENVFDWPIKFPSTEG